MSELSDTAREYDRAAYVEGIAEGQAEFPTECPDWCEHGDRLEHRLPEDEAGTREHSRAFGPYLLAGASERQVSPGRLFGAEVRVNAPDYGTATAEELRQLAADALAAAEWLEAR